ncbi:MULTISPECIES: hypothetical protein [unclassified Streptomyces]|uniref:hypothetical protein n=1 Tax=unclassified Streptomyces TaxID=2593676 RepID=UPI0011E7D6F3|nr:hypothetical protein [Streptomyces sp. sk2.1]TXS74185.1 hypothetical protein EAO76_16570 [Streptomyces sp. sk2.1]
MARGRGIPHTDVLVTLMGSPHGSDLFTSVLRLVEEMLRQDAAVQVWACGYATMLTQEGLGESKPRNLANWSGDYPSTLTVIRGLLAAHPGRLHWYGCRFCSDERGAVAHIPEVRLRAPSAFAENVAAADKTLFVGVL